MICPVCKGEIIEGAIVCKHCGANLGRLSVPKRFVILSLCLFLLAPLSLAYFFLGYLDRGYLALVVPYPVEWSFHAAVFVVLPVIVGMALLRLKRWVWGLGMTWVILAALGNVLAIHIILKTPPWYPTPEKWGMILPLMGYLAFLILFSTQLRRKRSYLRY
ncbi:MAG: hypothetical protein JW937_01615 [Candidatus Omnitrophica bacterium]|nr:hypothetical protein [Candidatus Omnitrophota bacterium]